MTNPPLLKLQIRARLEPDTDKPREIVEVLKYGEVIGQLPVSKIQYEITPRAPGKILLEFHSWKVDMETHD